MAKKKSADEETTAASTQPSSGKAMLREPAEVIFAHEIEALMQADRGEKPVGWRLSPRRSTRISVAGPAAM